VQEALWPAYSEMAEAPSLVDGLNRSVTATKVLASPGSVGACIGCNGGECGGVGAADGLNRSSSYASSGLQAALIAVAKPYPGMAVVLQSPQLGPAAIFFCPVRGTG